MMTVLEEPKQHRNTLAALLKRWPALCSLRETVTVAPASTVIPGPCALLVQTGNGRLRVGTRPEEQLFVRDLVVVSQPTEIELLPGVGEPSSLGSRDPWTTLVQTTEEFSVLLISLTMLAGPENRELLPDAFVIRRPLPEDSLALLITALDGVANSEVTEAVRDAVATSVVLEALHRHFASRPRDVHWLTGLFDDEIGPVVCAMLQQPSQEWTVESLADVGGMSRSAFARKFRDLMDAAPIDFLVEIRMWQAAKQLRQRSADLKTIAREAGYQSPAAFSVAFKRWSGETPSDYRRGGRE